VIFREVPEAAVRRFSSQLELRDTHREHFTARFSNGDGTRVSAERAFDDHERERPERVAAAVKERRGRPQDIKVAESDLSETVRVQPVASCAVPARDAMNDIEGRDIDIRIVREFVFHCGARPVELRYVIEHAHTVLTEH
jgi:hypothetical protein